MKVNSYFFAVAATLLLFLTIDEARAQFTTLWLDIGEYQHRYVESGALREGDTANNGLLWPAIMRSGGHIRARAFWIGVKDWTSPSGQTFPWYTSRMGPRDPGIEFTSPISNRLISRFEDPVVEVDGVLSFSNVAVVDEVDPTIVADRMVHTIYNMSVGVTTERKAYAWDNEFHDQYHLIEYVHTNTGNTDDDEDIELPNQTLNDVYFFRVHRWAARATANVVSGAQLWGKFSMPDQVGDGHAEYPVDFTAIYLWYGFDPAVTQFGGNGGNLGAPLWNDNHDRVMEGDSVGRLGAGSMQGRVILHVDSSPSDETYVRCTPATAETCQPHTMFFLDTDEPLNATGLSHEDYYELGILTRENPTRVPGGHSRMNPHYADRIQPNGEFWNPTADASNGKQGGHANTIAYGPYQMAPGDDIRIVVAEGVAGLSFDAEFKIGRAFKRGGEGRAQRVIEYDANSDGVIDTTPFDYSQVFTGTEAMTKNQWVFSARDSLFAQFFDARNVFEASNDFTAYPIPEGPRPPALFSVFGRPDKVDVTWDAPAGGSARTTWELYRTSRFEDNLYGNGCLGDLSIVCGYELIATLDGSATSYEDTDLVRGTDYYYYIQAVGAPQPDDPTAMAGTPGGVPLRSGRYYTQTYQPVNLKRPPGNTVNDFRVVPNPVNLGADATVRFDVEDRMAFFNIPGQCEIKIYTEIGELVHTIEHTDGSGDELWNLTTTSRQLLVSGIYIAVVEDLDSGAMSMQKFTVLR